MAPHLPPSTYPAHLTVITFFFIIIQGPAETPEDFAVSGIVGVGNLSLSALLARLKAFQLPWSAGL
jgi:hypothetical protein